MKRIPLVSLSVGLFLSNPWCALGQTAPEISLPVPVDVQIPMPPTPVKADGKWWLVYELHVTNFHTNNVELVRVEVLRDRAKGPMATYTGEELSRRLAAATSIRRKLPSDPPNPRVIGRAMR